MGTLRAREIFNQSGVTLIAVESVDIQHSKSGSVGRLYGKLEPIAVVVCGSGDAHAFDMEAMPVDLDQLKQAVPELDALTKEPLFR